MTASRDGVPYWRLSNFYFFYFATLGALIPYWGLYLGSLGFSAVAIGQLLAIMMATKIVAPNIWGAIADHTGERMRIVRITSLLAAVTYLGVFVSPGFAWLALVMAVYSFFWNAALPQFEATTLNHLGERTHYYSRIRLWGSIGFIAAVVAVGYVLELEGTGRLPVMVLIFLAGIWVASLFVTEQEEGKHPPGKLRLRQVLRRPEVIAILAVSYLMQASHGAYYAFFSIYLDGYGYSKALTGQLWALGVIAEVGIFIVMHRLHVSFRLRHLLLASLALTAVRWLLTSQVADHLWLLAGTQLLHAASFGVFHATAIAYIHRYFPGRTQGRGQALYSSISFGAGGATGSLLSGYAWDSAGPESTYLIACVLSVAALLVAWGWVGQVSSAAKIEV